MAIQIQTTLIHSECDRYATKTAALSSPNQKIYR